MSGHYAGYLAAQNARNEAFKSFAAAEDVLFRADGLSGFRRLIPDGALRTSLSPEWLALAVTGRDARLLLPPLELPASRHLAISMEITAPKCTRARLLYLEQAGGAEREVQAAAQDIPQGHSIVHLEARESGMNGFLRLIPGEADGEYRLHSLEVRGVPEESAW